MQIIDICFSEDMHPYNCGGAGKCRHCDREKDDEHNPEKCALCDPDYDGNPNEYRGYFLDNTYWTERVNERFKRSRARIANIIKKEMKGELPVDEWLRLIKNIKVEIRFAVKEYKLLKDEN